MCESMHILRCDSELPKWYMECVNLGQPSINKNRVINPASCDNTYLVQYTPLKPAFLIVVTITASITPYGIPVGPKVSTMIKMSHQLNRKNELAHLQGKLKT